MPVAIPLTTTTTTRTNNSSSTNGNINNISNIVNENGFTTREYVLSNRQQSASTRQNEINFISD